MTYICFIISCSLLPCRNV